jgi:hypothetical protein
MTVFARTTLVAACCFAVPSCTGAAETDVLGPLATEPTPPPFPSDDATDPATSAPTKPKADAGAAPKNDDDAKGKGPRRAEPSCPAEKEDNGSEAKANALVDCVRGTLAGSNDKDFFRLPVSRDGHLLIAHNEKNGRVQYKVTEENGQPVTGLNVTFSDRAPDITVQANKAYFFQLSFPDLSGGDGPRQYEFTITLQ